MLEGVPFCMDVSHKEKGWGVGVGYKCSVFILVSTIAAKHFDIPVIMECTKGANMLFFFANSFPPVHNFKNNQRKRPAPPKEEQ